MPPNLKSDTSLLSDRAQAVARPSPGTLIWEVLRDQWDPQTNPDGFVSIGVAENRLIHNELAPHIAENTSVSQSAFTYGDGPFGSHRSRKAVARFLNKHLKPVEPLDSDKIIITNGVSHSIEHTSWAFCNPGDGFLLGRPHYGAFIPDIELRPGVKVVPVSFGDVDSMSVEAVANYERALLDAREHGVKVKALMLCSPHNPLGRCYSREALIAFLKFCEKYQVHLVSDEIYALSTWENKEEEGLVPFASVLSIDFKGLINPSLVHVLWGMSKDFGANGIRLGCVITTNTAFREAMNSVAIYSYASAISDHVVANILEDNEWTDMYIKTNQARLSESYSYVVDFLRKHNLEYARGSNAAFFLWVDLGKAYLKRHPDRNNAKEITDEVMQALLKQKIYLASGAVFGSEQPSMFRIVFSHPRPYIGEALSRIIKAIDVGVTPNEYKAKL